MIYIHFLKSFVEFTLSLLSFFDCAKQSLKTGFTINFQPLCLGRGTQLTKPTKQVWIKALNPEPAVELHSRATPSVEAQHCVSGPTTGRNSGGRRNKNLCSPFNWSTPVLFLHQVTFPEQFHIFFNLHKRSRSSY